MATDLTGAAGDECCCLCHRDPSVRHAVACCADCPDCATRVRSTVHNDGHRPLRCGGFRLGRRTVRINAWVSVLAGLALIVVAIVHPIMGLAVHGATGLIALCVGVFLFVAPGRIPLRAILSAATAVNAAAVAAALIGGLAVTWDHSAVRVLAIIAALAGAVFTVVEAVALARTAAR